MSNVALFSGLSGAGEAVADVGKKRVEADLTEKAREAQQKRDRRMAEYDSNLRRDEADHQSTLDRADAKYEKDLEIAGLEAQKEAGLLKSTGDDVWDKILRTDEMGNERVFLYNKVTGEVRDNFGPEGEVRMPEDPPTWAEAQVDAKETYGVDVQGDEIAEGHFARGDFAAFEARVKALKKRRGAGKENKNGEKPPKADPRVENANAALERELGERSDSLFPGYKSAADAVKTGLLKPVGEAFDKKAQDARIQQALQLQRDSRQAPNKKMLRGLSEISEKALREAGIAETTIEAVRRFRQ